MSGDEGTVSTGDNSISRKGLMWAWQPWAHPTWVRNGNFLVGLHSHVLSRFWSYMEFTVELCTYLHPWALSCLLPKWSEGPSGRTSSWY